MKTPFLQVCIKLQRLWWIFITYYQTSCLYIYISASKFIYTTLSYFSAFSEQVSYFHLLNQQGNSFFFFSATHLHASSPNIPSYYLSIKQLWSLYYFWSMFISTALKISDIQFFLLSNEAVHVLIGDYFIVIFTSFFSDLYMLLTLKIPNLSSVKTSS